MTSPSPDRTAIVRTVCATVLGLAVLSALVVLYGVTAPTGRPDLRPLFSALVAGASGASGALVLWLSNRKTHAETTGRLETITAQTNGVLTDRIAAGVASALAARDAAASLTPVIVDRRLIPDQPPPPPATSVVIPAAPAPEPLAVPVAAQPAPDVPSAPVPTLPATP